MAHDADAIRAALGGPAGVDQCRLRHVAEEAPLRVGAPCHTGRADHPDARRVRGCAVLRTLVQRLDERTAEGVTDDRQDRCVLLLDRRQREVRVEASPLERDDGAARSQRRQRGERERRAVHERRCRHGDRSLTSIPELDRRGGWPRRPVDVDAADQRPSVQGALGDAGHLIHHAFRQPGRAAGVGEVHAARPRRAGDRRMAGDEVLVVRAARVGIGVVHLDDPAQERQLRGDLPDSVGEGGVDDHDLGIGVVEQLAQLVVAVAVVDVDVDGVELDRGEEGLEVLAAVVQVEGDLGSVSDTGCLQRRGEAGGAIVELVPGAHTWPVDQGDLVPKGVRDRFPDRREVQFHIDSLHRIGWWPQ